MTIKEGDAVPHFDMPTDDGGRASNEALRGKPFVLYFYPRDDTPGCTKEAIGFSQSKMEFDRLGLEVIGVSKDGLASHCQFRDKHALSIRLASDEDGQTCEAFGCWVEKSMYGKTYMGIDRATFLVDMNGRVARVWRKVKVPGHVEEVLDAARALAARQTT
jgi:peroxiredoxin Q/BCP